MPSLKMSLVAGERSQYVWSRISVLQGIIYLPSRDVIFNHGSSLTSKKMLLYRCSQDHYVGDGSWSC